MSELWAYIRGLIGPGLHWSKPQETFLDAIDRAREDGQPEAAHHIEIMLEMRNRVMCEEKTPRREDGANGCCKN